MTELEKLLENKTVGSYKKAARLIRKEKRTEFGDALYHFLETVIGDPKKWEVSCEIITTLGIIEYREAEPLLNKILENPSDDMISMKASTAWVRIRRKNLEDANPVLDLLNKKNDAIAEGALEALGYDRMVPDPDQQTAIIDLCWDLGATRNKNAFTDPRYGLAAACAGWSSPKVQSFLKHCLEEDDVPLTYVAKNALEKKYVKLR